MRPPRRVAWRGGVLVPALMLLPAGCGGDPEVPAPPIPVVDSGRPAAPAPRPMTEDRLRRGEGLEAPLDRLGVTADERGALVAALRGVADVRRLSAGTGVGVVRGPRGGLRMLALRTAEDTVVRVEARDGAFAARSETLAPEVGREVLGAIVRTSVYDAVIEAGGSPELVLAFSDVFQWDLDFFAEPRVGDQVMLVYETMARAATPPATPAWQGRPDEPGADLGAGRILAAAYAGSRVAAEGFWFEGEGGRAGYYDGEGNSLRKTFLKSPLNYRRISSGFSRARRNPVTRTVLPHRAVDYAADPGTPVVASADGRVVAAGYQGALGRQVRIRHGSGRYETVYGHFSRIAKGIRVGATVEQNQVIGYVGSTGRATGPHLHFELHDNGRPINPLTIDNPSTAPIPDEARPAFEQVVARYREALDRNAPGPAVAGLSASD